MYVIELFGMSCIGYVCVTQRKGPEEELLSALLGTLRWKCDNPHRPWSWGTTKMVGSSANTE